jgi:hypothetical protein
MDTVIVRQYPHGREFAYGASVPREGEIVRFGSQDWLVTSVVADEGRIQVTLEPNDFPVRSTPPRHA